MGSFQRREFMKLYTVIQVLFNPSLYLLTGKCTYSCFFILFLSYIISGLGIQSFDLSILKIARDLNRSRWYFKKIDLDLNRSPWSFKKINCEQIAGLEIRSFAHRSFAQVTQDKWATMSDSLRLLRGNEQKLFG